MEQFEVKIGKNLVQFVTVLESFTHHYTGETIRKVRIEYILPISKCAMVEVEYLDQAEYDELCKCKITTP